MEALLIAPLQVVPEGKPLTEKNAISLCYHGTRIGYVAQGDAIPFATCLNLGREVYGVITDIREREGGAQIEFEAWFSDKIKKDGT